MAAENFDWTPRRRVLATVLACAWLAYLVPVAVDLARRPPAAPVLVLAVAGLAVFVACFVRLTVVGMRVPFRLAAPYTLLVLVAVSVVLMWPIGQVWRYAAPYYLAALLPAQLPIRWWAPAQLAVLAGAAAAGWYYGDTPGSLTGYLLSVLAVALMLSMFFWMLTLLVRLRAARAGLARLAVSDERLRIARDLHDVLGQRLSVVTLTAELAARLVPDAPEQASERMREAARVARESLAEMRATVSGFRDTSLPGELAAARALLAAADVECVVVMPDLTGVPDAVTRAAGWVLREGVTNVVRHARAGRCWITAQRVPGRVCLEVADDGRGVGAGPGWGNGLTGLAERVSRLGGTLRVTTADRYRLSADLPTESGEPAEPTDHAAPAERAGAAAPATAAGGAAPAGVDAAAPRGRPARGRR